MISGGVEEGEKSLDDTPGWGCWTRGRPAKEVFIVLTDAMDCALLCEFALEHRVEPAVFVHWELATTPDALEVAVGTLIEGIKSGGGVAVASRFSPADKGNGRAPPGRGTRLVRRSARYSAAHALCEPGTLPPGVEGTKRGGDRDFKGEDLRGE
jgi:hypothetical protein